MAKHTGSVLLQFILCLFLIVLGIGGVLPSVEESVFTLTNFNYMLEVIFGIAEIVCGAILFLDLFDKISQSLMSLVTMVVFIFWAARIIITKVIFGVTIVGGNIIFYPDLYNWILILMVELIVLFAIWNVRQRSS